MMEVVTDSAHSVEHMARTATEPGSVCDQVDVWFNGQWVRVPVWSREDLMAEQCIDGPALIIDPHATIVVSPGWRAEQMPAGWLGLEGQVARRAPLMPPQLANDQAVARPDPAHLEIFNNLFMAFASQMGEVLR